MHSAEAMCQTPPTVADERPTALLADLGAETPGLMELTARDRGHH